MREILFRAKRKDNLEWIEGYYAKVKDYLTEKDIHVIFPIDTTLYPRNEFAGYEEIIPETVCRLIEHPCYDSDYTDRRFFQNDILGVYSSRHTNIEHREPDDIALVLDEHSIYAIDKGHRWFPQDTTQVKILGNAFDNPELLHGHALNHFVNDLREYPGDADEYLRRHKHYSEKYGIHGAHACCYMKNFESDYICHQFNGGCKYIDVCRRIEADEIMEMEAANSVVHAKWVPMKAYPSEYLCSYCGELWPDEPVEKCPGCGAIMDAVGYVFEE